MTDTPSIQILFTPDFQGQLRKLAKRAPRKIQILLRIGKVFQWFQSLRIRSKAINRGAQTVSQYPN